jgi:hypothetical protein
MAKKRAHTDMSNTAMPRAGVNSQPGNFPRGGPPRSKTAAGRSATPVQPSGEVSTQKRGLGKVDLDKAPRTPYERGFNPDIGSRRERNPPGGSQRGLSMSDVYSAMPKTGRQSATTPGALAYPGSERNSATMDARSSVPTSIQEGRNTRDRFGDLGMYEKTTRADNAEIDDGTGTGRRARGSFRGNRRM